MDEITHAHKCEIAKDMIMEFAREKTDSYSLNLDRLGFSPALRDIVSWLDEQIEQEELLEIEKDVLLQQEELG